MRRRLLVGLLVPLLFIGVVALLDAYRTARSTADKISDRVLAGSALAISERVFVNEAGVLEVDIPYIALEMLTSSEEDRVFYKIETSNGEFVTGYRNLATPGTVAGTDQNTSFSDDVFRGSSIRVAVHQSVASSSSSSLGYRVLVAETTNGRRAIAREILLRSAVRQAVLIIVAVLIVWFAVTLALRPLHKLQAAISRRSADDVRPIEHRVPSEVSGLVTTVNDLVTRFAGSLETMRNFTSNTSHQLRTPLALIRTHLEIARRSTNARQKNQAIADANEAVGNAERLMAQMLTLAKIDSVSREKLTGARCDLSSLCKEVCGEFVLQLSQSGKTGVDLGFETRGETNVVGDHTLLKEVVRNLIDNAIQYGGNSVHITASVAKAGREATLTVVDNGPGIEGQNPDMLMSRFKRGDQQTKPGSGLGFAIVSEILALFDGKFEVRVPESGTGMIAEVKLKLVEA